MDLTTLWQEHRVFITSVVAGLLFFLVGQSLISGVYSVEDKKRSVARLERELRTLRVPGTEQLERARALNERLKRVYERARKRAAFVPNERYVLSGKEKPDVQYDRLFNEARDALVEFAKTLNITVDPGLGMPELSPTRPAEIQRALYALDMVTRVVLLAVESRVRSVDGIAMKAERGRVRKGFLTEQKVRFKMTGSAAAMAEFLRRFALQENFLALDEAVFRAADRDGNSVTADFTVSALTITEEEAET